MAAAWCGPQAACGAGGDRGSALCAGLAGERAAGRGCKRHLGQGWLEWCARPPPSPGPPKQWLGCGGACGAESVWEPPALRPCAPCAAAGPRCGRWAVNLTEELGSGLAPPPPPFAHGLRRWHPSPRTAPCGRAALRAASPAPRCDAHPVFSPSPRREPSRSHPTPPNQALNFLTLTLTQGWLEWCARSPPSPGPPQQWLGCGGACGAESVWEPPALRPCAPCAAAGPRCGRWAVNLTEELGSGLAPPPPPFAHGLRRWHPSPRTAPCGRAAPRAASPAPRCDAHPVSAPAPAGSPPDPTPPHQTKH